MEFPTLQDQVRMDEERALSQYVPDNLLLILIIVKRPLLALRYTRPDGQIRRMQMNFVPYPGCDVALETFRGAGLPIRDKDLPQLQGQRRQSSQSQPRSEDRPGSSNIDQAGRPQSSQGLFPDSSQPLSQGNIGVREADSDSIPPSKQPTKVDVRPTSAPDVGRQKEFGRLISASSRSTLNAFGSPITVTSAPTVAKQRPQSGLLPSPVLNGAYESFGSNQVGPLSAPEQTQTQLDLTSTLLHSRMLPPERTLPFQERKIQQCKTKEAALQERPAQKKPAATKAEAKSKTNRRAQPAKPRKSRAKAETTTTSSTPLVPSSPSPTSRVEAKAPTSNGPPRFASPELQVTTSLLEPPQENASGSPRLTRLEQMLEDARLCNGYIRTEAPITGKSLRVTLPIPKAKLAAMRTTQPSALPSINPRKRSLTAQASDQPNKRQTQASAQTVTENSTGDLRRNAVVEGPLQAQPSEATNPLIKIGNHDLLDRIDHLIRIYHDPPAFRLPLRTSKDFLAEWAAQAETDRIKAMNDLISECIKDEKFAKLMDDIEGAWKRIGL